MFTPEMLALRRKAAAQAGPDTHAITSHSSGTDSYTIWDITDPTNPTVTGNVNRTAFDGLWFAVKDGYLYSGRGNSLDVFDVSDPTSPSFVTAVSMSGFVTSATSVWAHPDKDFILVISQSSSGAFVIIDISNPASPSVNGYDYSGTPVGAPNSDFSKFYALANIGTSITSYPLSNTNPSGTGSTESLSITSAPKNIARYANSPVNGEGYLWFGGNDNLGVIKFGSDNTPDSEYYQSSTPNWDRLQFVFPFSSYYSTTYESVAAVNARDDDKIMVVGFDGSSFTILASDVPSTASVLALGMWVTGNYIISVDNLADRMYIHEWDSETSLTLLSDTYSLTYLDGATRVVTYSP